MGADRFEQQARLGRLAVQRGILSDDQLRRALAAQLQAMERGERPRALGDLLVDFGYLTRDQLAALEAAAPDPPDYPPLGRFDLVREIGRGAMGVVYESVDRSTGERVALKLLVPGAGMGAPEQERLLREARLAAKLPPHPGIVAVRESGVLEGKPYLAMDLVEGRNLSEWLKLGSVTLRQFVGLLRDVAVAVDHAHRHGVVHRDLKPENVLVDRDRRPRVTDFGHAKLVDAEGSGSGPVVGTPAYMSPEQVKGAPGVDGRTDVFALGVMLYEGIAGERPFEGRTAFEVMTKSVNEAPASLTRMTRIQMNPLLFRNLENICLTALAKDPRDRYRTAGALAHDLTRWLNGEEFAVPAPRPRTTAPPARSRRRWAAAAVGGALAAAVLLLLLRTPEGRAPAAVDPAALRPGAAVEFYGGIHFNALGVRAVDARRGFDLPSDPVWSDGPEYYVSLRWSGYLRAPRSREYLFTLRAPEGARLRIGGREVASSWTQGGQASGRVRLEKGDHEVVLESFHAGADRGIEATWDPDGAPVALGPALLLHDPAEVKPFGPPRGNGPVEIPDAQEAETLAVLESGGVPPVVKAYAPFGPFWQGQWSGSSHLWWGVGVQPGHTLRLRFASKAAGRRTLVLAMTRAMDHGVFRVAVNGRTIAERLDLYDPNLVTGEREFPEVELQAGANELSFTALGANPAAREWAPGGGLPKLGLDYVRLR